MLKPKLYSEQGFTLVEVLVAILVITVFVATTMQMLAIAAVFKARAKQYSEATALIQQDLENVKSQANTLKSTTLNAIAAPGDSTITIAPNTTFVPGDILRVGGDFQGYTIPTNGINGNTITVTPSLNTTLVTNVSSDTVANVSTIPVNSVVGFKVGDPVKIGSLSTIYTISGNTSPNLSVNPAITVGLAKGTPIQLAQSVGSIVSAINRCPTLAVQPTSSTGFGSLLNLPTTLTTSPTTVNTTIGDYILTRTANIKNTAPYETVQLNYTVRPQPPVTNTSVQLKPVATQNAEVIVGAALKCP